MSSSSRPRLRALVSILGLLPPLVSGPTAGAQEPPSFPAAEEQVRIDAVVVDETGRPVTGLTAADFVVEENGEPRDVVSFEAIVVRSRPPAPAEAHAPTSGSGTSTPLVMEPEDGRALLVFFDDIHVSPANAQWLLPSLGAFLERELRPGDAVTVVAPHANVWWTARTPQEHAQLPAVLAGLKGQYSRDPFRDEPSDWQVMQQLEYGPGITEGGAIGSNPFSLLREGQYGAALGRIERTLTALERAIDSLEGFQGHKSVILYSEGFILSPRLDRYQRIVDRCRRANVAIFVSDPQGLRTGLPRAEDPTRAAGGATGQAGVPASRLSGGLIDAESAGSTHIALATGGRAYFLNDATEAVERVLEESNAYYLIGFRPTEGPPGERKLRVRVHRDGLEVRARNRYYRGDRLPASYDDAPAVAALRAMSDSTEVPFRVTALAGGASGDGPASTRLRLDLGPAGSSRQLKLLVEVRPLEGEPVHDVADLTVPPSASWLPVERELHLSPGVWQARVVVVDAETGAMGSALHPFAVPARGGRGPRGPTR